LNQEEAILFRCGEDELCGILHLPAHAVVKVGLLLVVGGPQYRIGSHRQFVLLARFLADAGIPVLRFDYRGMGDSEGTPRDFEAIGDDIGSAVDVLCSAVPQLDGVVLWGLCDAATANAFYTADTGDARISGQVAVNPWVRTAEGQAEAYVRHYYRKRLLSSRFWTDLWLGKVDVPNAVAGWIGNWRQASRGREQMAQAAALPDRLKVAQTASVVPTLLILSGEDLTAKEYEARVADSSVWSAWLESEAVTVRRLPEADHTFSRGAWRNQVSVWTRDWLFKLFEPAKE
jgi:exosortase A-associated hydrolase 1